MSGQSANLLKGSLVGSSAGTFALTGQAASLRRDLRLTAAVGSFALTGQTATLRRALPLTAAVGSFALTGQAAALKRQVLPLTAVLGSFTVNGQPADFALGLPAALGTFALTGQTTGLRRTALAGADVGSFALNGEPAGLTATRKITAALGSFTLTGEPVTLARGVGLVGGYGSFALSGQSITLHHDYHMVAVGGTFALTGQIAHRLLGLFVAQAYRLVADTGGFYVRGYNVVTPARFAQGGQRAAPPNRRRVKPRDFEFISTDGALVLSGSARVFVEQVSLRRVYGGRGNLGLQACALVEIEEQRVTYAYQSRAGSGVRIPGGSAVSSYTPGLRAYAARTGPMSRTLSRWGGSAVCELQTRQRRSA